MLYVGEYLDLFSIALIREAWLEYGDEWELEAVLSSLTSFILWT